MNPKITEIAKDLRFPEGPVAMPDGSIILVEIAAGRVSRIAPDGKRTTVAEPGGGPNGAAMGPGGKLYLCNNGGNEWYEKDGRTFPGLADRGYSGGRIERVDLDTGKVEVLYTECDGEPLKGPNDLVFDGKGGFWFTDHGKTYRRSRDRGALFYARADGSLIREVVGALDGPNGVGLSPDGSRVYTVETHCGRFWGWDIKGEGEVERVRGGFGHERGHLLAGLPGYQLLDSLAVDAEGYVCAATIGNGGITAVSPDGKVIEHYALPDPLVTNVCFGGPGLRTAFATLSMTGKLVSFEWPRPGLGLHHLNR